MDKVCKSYMILSVGCFFVVNFHILSFSPRFLDVIFSEFNLLQDIFPANVVTCSYLRVEGNHETDIVCKSYGAMKFQNPPTIIICFRTFSPSFHPPFTILPFHPFFPSKPTIKTTSLSPWSSLCSHQSHKNHNLNHNNNNNNNNNNKHPKTTVRNDIKLCQKMVRNDLKLRQLKCALPSHSRKERKEDNYEQKNKSNMSKHITYYCFLNIAP